MSLHRPRRVAFLATAALVLVVAAVGATFAAFTSTSDNPGNSVAAASDFRAPPISSQVVSKTQGGTTSYIKQGGTYDVYANVGPDTGNPASGISNVTANASSVTTGQTAAAMTAGSYTVGGTTYNYRTASLTANAVLAAGSKAFSVTATDNASNTSTTNGAVTVDNTAPTAGATSPPGPVQATNTSGGIVGRAEAGDTLTLTASEQLEPISILASWSGTALQVTVRLNDGGAGNDSIQIWNSANSTQLNLGTISLGRTDYTSASRTFSGASCTITRSGNDLVIVLGTASGATTTAAANSTAVWTPSATATDRAGNAMSTTAGSETGTADKEF